MQDDMPSPSGLRVSLNPSLDSLQKIAWSCTREHYEYQAPSPHARPLTRREFGRHDEQNSVAGIKQHAEQAEVYPPVAPRTARTH